MTGKRDDHERGVPPSADVLDGDLEALVRESLERLLPLMKPKLAEVFRRAETKDRNLNWAIVTTRLNGSVPGKMFVDAGPVSAKCHGEK